MKRLKHRQKLRVILAEGKITVYTTVGKIVDGSQFDADTSYRVNQALSYIVQTFCEGTVGQFGGQHIQVDLIG